MPVEVLRSWPLTGVTFILRDEELPVSSERIAEMEKSAFFLCVGLLLLLLLLSLLRSLPELVSDMVAVYLLLSSLSRAEIRI